ncbi:Pre-rRNA-processing protein esf1 [Portunus trituberculatus]|uniref:Pre-rRNA-processing protein esf1 n=1 Tax=Portunus trituberculatus TaxID=210409 RepID=A0A5B7JYP4_PORTR|nr:Pre-rRNA-processing protein esf1 [Portunus trituberculatus]
MSDPRFSKLMTSGDYNIDPSHPQFKRTQAMDSLIGEIQRKRMAESGEMVSILCVCVCVCCVVLCCVVSLLQYCNLFWLLP